MYDAIIVGARCAGSPTAMLLARQGYRVLVVDRATFPSDIMSTHYIKQPGIVRLNRWGLLDRVAASGCPPITTATLDFDGVVLRGTPPRLPGSGDADYCPRRTALDTILVQAAVAAGAELRQGFTVQEITFDEDGQVTGIRGRGRDGGTVTERARIVIGADGRRSLVARAVRAPKYQEVPPLECGYYSYFSGIETTGFELYFRPRRFMLVVPTNDGLTCLAVAAPVDEFETYRADIEGYFVRSLDSAPELAARVRAGRRAERWTGTADLPNFFRKPYGPGWALVGDAGYHKDPINADGISDAFRDAELLAEAIDAGFSGPAPLGQTLAGYQRQRDAASAAGYQSVLQNASHQPPSPEQLMLMRAIATSQEETDRFLGVMVGLVPPEEFYAPENVSRIMAAVGRARVHAA